MKRIGLALPLIAGLLLVPALFAGDLAADPRYFLGHNFNPSQYPPLAYNTPSYAYDPRGYPLYGQPGSMNYCPAPNVMLEPGGQRRFEPRYFPFGFTFNPLLNVPPLVYDKPRYPYDPRDYPSYQPPDSRTYCPDGSVPIDPGSRLREEYRNYAYYPPTTPDRFMDSYGVPGRKGEAVAGRQYRTAEDAYSVQERARNLTKQGRALEAQGYRAEGKRLQQKAEKLLNQRQ